MSRAKYASDPAMSRGRQTPEPESQSRSAFQRDRDRIVHSTAFRRLKYKTQVFIYHEGDHYRTRLTHSIEVAQIARSIARALGLNEDLAEALALAHDLGHPPFGHSGEEALAELMKDHGGFDHNVQTLRIITRLESRYAAFDGLNLTWETLEGIAKHNGPLSKEDSADENPGGLNQIIGEIGLEPSTHASLEAQVAAISDDIAYDSHDIDDGVRAGLIDLAAMSDVPLVSTCVAEVDKSWPDLSDDRRLHESLRRLITKMVNDVIDETSRKLVARNISSANDVRQAGQTLAIFSDDITRDERALKAFLMENLYRHKQVRSVMDDAGLVVADIFTRYLNDASSLRDEWLEYQDEISDRPRWICDLVAGMTDRFALQEHARLFDHTPDLR